MGWNDKHKLNKNKQLNLFEQLSSEEKILLEFLRKNENSSIDKIMRESNIDKNKVSIFLLNLEFINLIKVLPGKRYRAL
jgi:predicted Rossmann fold nucleotide-binding protein DprA/Smf involved in DNA uptake